MQMQRTFYAFTLLIAICISSFIYWWPHIYTRLTGRKYYPKRDYKMILYWNPMFGDKNFQLGEGLVSSHCPRYSNCIATHKRFLLKSYSSYDAIIFNGVSEDLKTNLPGKRKPEQFYVFAALESPVSRQVSRVFNKFFNLTMTYQRNSDIVWTYGDVIDLHQDRILAVPSISNYKNLDLDEDKNYDIDDAMHSIAYGKSKVAVWYRSNCNAYSGREDYVSELQKHTSVDKFGDCSLEKGCPKGDNCFETVDEPNYFFYLAFENAFCDDYVTEKFYNALQYYIVPVVYGGANYSHFAPPNSYINALDFDSPKDLADYLNYLTRNVTEYVKYFEWKSRYRVTDSRDRVICDLCEILNTRKKKQYYPIAGWYTRWSCPVQMQLYQQQAEGGTHYATKLTLSKEKRTFHPESD